MEHDFAGLRSRLQIRPGSAQLVLVFGDPAADAVDAAADVLKPAFVLADPAPHPIGKGFGARPGEFLIIAVQVAADPFLGRFRLGKPLVVAADVGSDAIRKL